MCVWRCTGETLIHIGFSSNSSEESASVHVFQRPNLNSDKVYRSFAEGAGLGLVFSWAKSAACTRLRTCSF